MYTLAIVVFYGVSFILAAACGWGIAKLDKDERVVVLIVATIMGLLFSFGWAADVLYNQSQCFAFPTRR
jgi:biotin transporter BioY